MKQIRMIMAGGLVLLLAACATGFDTGSGGRPLKSPSPDDPEFRKICAEYGGAVNDFEPVLSQGLRTYGSVCGLNCSRALSEGFAFVDVIWLEYDWQNGSLSTRPKRVERYRPSAEFSPSCVTDEISRERFRNCFKTEKIKVPRAATELVLVRPGGSRPVSNEARIVPVPRERFDGIIRGSFSGYRSMSGGALNGYGSFSLLGIANQNGNRPLIARCPG